MATGAVKRPGKEEVSVRTEKFGVAKTPVVPSAKITDPTGGATVDSQARTAINSIIDALEAMGITASS